MAVVIKASCRTAYRIKIQTADKVTVICKHLISRNISKLCLCDCLCSLCLIKLAHKRIIKINAAIVTYCYVLNCKCTAAVESEHSIVTVRGM